jgi:hypothetical protein
MPSRSNGRDVDWPEDDVIELLAQLDFLVGMPQESSCLLTEDQRKEADENIILQLSKTVDGRYAPREVRNKLFNLYAEGDGTEYFETNFTIVFRLGSQEMRALDDTTRELVEERYNQLRWTSKIKRSSSRHLTPATHRVQKPQKNAPRLSRYQTRSRTATPCNV